MSHPIRHPYGMLGNAFRLSNEKSDDPFENPFDGCHGACDRSWLLMMAWGDRWNAAVSLYSLLSVAVHVSTYAHILEFTYMCAAVRVSEEMCTAQALGLRSMRSFH